MRFLEKLLDGAEVAWVPLGEVTQYVQPTKYLVRTKNYNDDFKTPVLTAGKTFILGYTDETDGINEASNSPVIIFDDFTTANKWVDFDFKAKSSAMKIISSGDRKKYILKYVYYWLNTLPNDLIAGDHKRQWISNFYNKEIPIPCPDNPAKSLAIQAEIVRILDAFTAMTTELTTELSARRKQYNYYREQLLTFSDDADVKWKSLGNVAEVRSGQGFPKAYQGQAEGHYPFYKVSDMNLVGNETTMNLANNYIDSAVAKKLGISPVSAGAIIFPKIGAAIATNKKRLLSIPSVYDNNVMGLIPNEKIISSRFLFYWMQMVDLSTLANDSGAIPSIRKSTMELMLVPILPLSEQARIVSILDKFHALTNSISEGLPREIELRRKQYEHYRDQLLDFPKSEKEKHD